MPPDTDDRPAPVSTAGEAASGTGAEARDGAGISAADDLTGSLFDDAEAADPAVRSAGPPAGPPADPPADPEEVGADGSAPNRRRHSGRRWLVELVVIVVIALVVAVVLRTFVVQTFYIPSASMEPTLQVGDRILVNKLSYHLHAVGRGDIVVFARPPGEAGKCLGPAVPDLVKRVIGLPGDTLSLRDGEVYVDGRRLAQPWLPAGVVTNPGPHEPETVNGRTLEVPAYSLANTSYTVPQGDYFLMGDNREDSCDSRYWGPIPKSLIVGKVDVRIWPLSRFHLF